MCNIAQLINVLQAVLLTDGPEGSNCVRTTSYYAFMLFKAHRSKTAVKVEYDGDRLPTGPPQGFGPGGQPPQQAPPAELSVSASRQGSELIATFVNPRHDVDMEIDCAVRGASAKSARAQLLHDSDINAANTFENPERVVIKPHEVSASGDRIRITLP